MGPSRPEASDQLPPAGPPGHGRGPFVGVRVVLACLVLGALFLPFVDMPFHVDDVAFLRLAGLLRLDPLSAEPEAIAYMGRVIPGFLPYESTHPLGVPYLLAGLVRHLGQREAPLHLAFLAFPALALVAFGFIERRLFSGGSARAWPIGVLLLASAPAFLVNAHTLMTDVPTLAFGLAGVACYLAFLERGGAGSGAAAALALTAAWFCSYQAGVFLALLGVLATLRRRLSVRATLPLWFPLLAMAAWLGLVFRAHGVFPLAASAIGTHGSIAGEVTRGLLLDNLVGKSVSVAANLGLAALLPLLWRRLEQGAALREAGWIVGLASPVLAALWGAHGWPPARAATLALLLSSCARGIVAVVSDLRREASPERWFLVAWVAAVAAYNVLLLPFGAARYALPALPPLLLLLLNPALAGAVATAPCRRAAQCALALSSVVLGLACAASDYEHAAVYRDFAEQARRFRASLGRPADVWYVGEWGMRHYMDAAGMRYLLADSNQPRRGDVVVIPEVPRLWRPDPALAPRLEPLGAREYRAVLPLRLLSRRAGAGFYAHHWGLLPFAFSREPVEWFEIYAVAR